jgi:hypothetical protein
MCVTVISTGFAGGHVVKVAALHTGNDVLETKFENLVKSVGVQVPLITPVAP